MREFCIVLGLLFIAVALRTSRRFWLRKMGALILLAASALFFYFVTGSIVCSLLGILVWVLLPWVELLTRVRGLRFPLDHRLHGQRVPNHAFFPNAALTLETMERENFRHQIDCSLSWLGTVQHHRLFVQEDARAVATLCLCEKSDVVFAFVVIASIAENGHIYRTTNFPFAPQLKNPPTLHWNHLPCTKLCFRQIWQHHREFLQRHGVSQSLVVQDREHLDALIETQMEAVVEYNMEQGIIDLCQDGHFAYTFRGMIFLWGQFIKDMIRLC